MAQNGATYLQQRLQTPQDVAAWNQWVAGLPPTNQVATLDPAGEIAFQNQIGAINHMLMMQQNQNAFAIGQQQADYRRQLLEMRKQQLLQKQGMPYQFNRRGMMNSGLSRHALNQFDENGRLQQFKLGQWNAGQLAGLQQGMAMNRGQARFQLANLRAGRAGQIVNGAIGGIGQGLQ